MRDVVIVGGGVAGLMAATYLGRFRRRALVIDGGCSRARWIPESHNIPGFAQGIGGHEFLSQLKTQAERYGAELKSGWADSIVRDGDGFEVRIAGRSQRSRYVILATGVEDHLPDLAGAEEAITRSLLRICPICDAYEAMDKRIAVIGDGARGEHEAEFLRTYSEQVCYLHVGADTDAQRHQRLADRGIELLEIGLKALSVKDHALVLTLPNGLERVFDVFYTALGCTPRIELASALGTSCDESNALLVSSHQQTSVDGVYAAGDVVRGLNQVVVAAGEAAIAATDIHNRLRRAGV